MKRIVALMKPGDWLALAAAAALTAALVPLAWMGGAPERAVVRRAGQIVAQLPLDRAQRIEVAGALGPTLIEVQPGRARVARDPGPRQYCVRQGWLTRAGAAAICAPSEVSLVLTGAHAEFDTLNY